MRFGAVQLCTLSLGGLIQVGCLECTHVANDVVELSDAQIERFFGWLDRVSGKLVAEPPLELCKEVCTELLGDQRWMSCNRYSVRVEEFEAGGAGGAGKCTMLTSYSCERASKISCSKYVKADGCGF